MAKRTARRRYVPPADRPTGTIPVVEESAACAVGNHRACHGTVLSLLAPVGTACACFCHERPRGVAA